MEFRSSFRRITPHSRQFGGELIARIDGRFNVLIPADKNLRYQQALSDRRIALVELPTNRWPVIRSIGARMVHAVENAAPGTCTVIAS